MPDFQEVMCQAGFFDTKIRQLLTLAFLLVWNKCHQAINGFKLRIYWC